MQKLHLSLIMDVGVSVYLQSENAQPVHFHVETNLLTMLSVNMNLSGIKSETPGCFTEFYMS